MDISDPEYTAVKDRCFVGVARVQLRSLNFDHPLAEPHRDLSKKAVNRLKRIFTIEGCLREQSENYVNAVVDRQHLRSALREANLRESDLIPGDDGRAPALPILKVSCLHGLHRVRAAQKFLDRDDQWWTVRLFSDDIGDPAARRVIEEYANSAPYTDGEVFWRIRTYHRDGDTAAEQRWWARLSATKRKDLKQLLRHAAFTEAFDQCLDYPGLWRAIRLGALHRFHSLKCDEEMLRYVHRIHRVWQQILGRFPGDCIDAVTVERLQLLAPRSSDFRKISSMVQKRAVFKHVTRSSDRQELLQNLRQVTCLIPSFFTFFENLKYLEVCVSGLRLLLEPRASDRETVFRSFRASYETPARTLLDTSSGRARCIRPAHAQRLAYLQLWLFAMRCFPDLAPATPRKDPGKPKPILRQRNPVRQQALATLAIDLGFSTGMARRQHERNPDEAIVRQLFIHAGVESPASSCVRSVLISIEEARTMSRSGGDDVSEDAIASDIDSLSDCSDDAGLGLSHVGLARRCGRPYERDHYADASSLYARTVLNAQLRLDEPVTTLWVKRDFLDAFLGLEGLEPPPLVTDDPADDDGGPGPSPQGRTGGEDVSRLQARIQLLQSDRDRFESISDAQASEISALRSAQDQWNRDRASLQRRHTDLVQTDASEIDNLRNRLADAQRDSESLRRELWTAQQQVQVLSTRLGDGSAREEANRLRTDLADQRARTQAHSVEITELKNRLARVVTDLETARAEEAAAKAARDETGAELIRLRIEASQPGPAAHVQDTESRLEASNAALEAARAQYRDLEEEKKARLELATVEMRELRQRIANLEETRESLSNPPEIDFIADQVPREAHNFRLKLQGPPGETLPVARSLAPQPFALTICTPGLLCMIDVTEAQLPDFSRRVSERHSALRSIYMLYYYQQPGVWHEVIHKQADYIEKSWRQQKHLFLIHREAFAMVPGVAQASLPTIATPRQLMGPVAGTVPTSPADPPRQLMGPVAGTVPTSPADPPYNDPPASVSQYQSAEGNVPHSDIAASASTKPGIVRKRWKRRKIRHGNLEEKVVDEDSESESEDGDSRLRHKAGRYPGAEPQLPGPSSDDDSSEL